MASAFALIINNEFFDDKSIPRRIGSLNDVLLLKKVFYKFCFRVAISLDPALENIRDLMNESLIKWLSGASCLFVVLMTHGAQHDHAYAKNGTFNITKEILNSRAFRQLEHLPKIVLVQACKDVPIKEFEYVECQIKNILRFDSTFEGSKTVRMHSYTPFIHTFCKILDESGLNMDINEIVDKVIAALECDKDIKKICDHYPTKHLIHGKVNFCAGNEIKTQIQKLYMP